MSARQAKWSTVNGAPKIEDGSVDKGERAEEVASWYVGAPFMADNLQRFAVALSHTAS